MADTSQGGAFPPFNPVSGGPGGMPLGLDGVITTSPPPSPTRPPILAYDNNFPSQAFYIAPGNVLWLDVITYVASVDLDIVAIVQTGPNQQKRYRWEFNAASDADLNRTSFVVEPGYLLGLHATTQTPGVRRGSTYVTLGLTEQGVTPFGVTGILVQAYLEEFGYVSWPFTKSEFPREQPGEITAMDLSNGGTNANILYTIPEREILNILGFHARLVTDATVTSRHVSFKITPDNTAGLAWRCPTNQTASLTRQYELAYSFTDFSAASPIFHQLVGPPPVLALPGWSLEVVVGNMQTGDFLNNCTLVVEKWVIRS